MVPATAPTNAACRSIRPRCRRSSCGVAVARKRRMLKPRGCSARSGNTIGDEARAYTERLASCGRSIYLRVRSMNIRAPLRLAAVGGLSGAMLAALTLEDGLRKVSDERRQAYVRRWARSMLALLGVEAEVDRAVGTLEEASRPRLVVANHRSTLDILLLLSLFGGQLLARGDMANWTAIGLM